MKTPDFSSTEETIFWAALQRVPAGRAAYLDEACAGDPAMRRRTVALGGVDGSLRIVGPEAGQERVVANAHAARVLGIDASLDGSTLALTAYSSLAFSPDGSRLAAASDKEAKMFDTATGQEVFSLKEPGLQLAFTRDGDRLLAVNNKRAFLLDAPPLAQLQFGWLKVRPPDEAPPYLGPGRNYSRPDRP